MNRTPIHLKPLPEPKLEILNLIDILITLVAFFMLTSTFVENQSRQNLGIHLPQVRRSAMVNQDNAPIILELNKDRQLYFRDRKISLGNLEKLLQKQPQGTVIMIKADKDCRYSWVVELLEIAACCKLNKVALEVRKQ